MRSPADSIGGRRDASMVLLTHLVEDSLDQGYARAAARRAAGAPRQRHGRVLLVVGLVAVGLLLTTAGVQTRERASSAAQARAALRTEIEDRSAVNDRIQASLNRERNAVTRERRAALRLSADGVRLAGLLATLESATGAGAVRGPGMSVTLTDAPAQPTEADDDARTETGTDGRVSDRDLQTVVNEIWAAGAEAVVVNEQRLTALSAIRSAGDAVLVDFRPLSPPYVVTAVGPPDLRTTFVSGFGGSYLQVLRDYGIDYSVEDSDELVLPASAGLTLRHATAPRDVPSGTTVDPQQGERTP